MILLVITLGYFMPLAGENQGKVYTSLTGGKVDNNPSNDTVAINALAVRILLTAFIQ